MATKEIRTFLDIQNAVISRAKLDGDDDDVRDDVKEKINTSYQKIGIEEPYRWSGDTRPLRLRAKYSTGTVALTNGSDQVTGTSTAWTQNAHEGMKFYVSGVNRPYKVISINASTQIATLDAPWTGTTQSGATYALFKDEYGMYPDFQDLRKFWIPGMATRAQPLPCGPDQMDSLRGTYPFRAGLPVRYTVNGYNIYTEKTWATFNLNTDFWEDDYDARPRNHNLVLWPCILTSDTIANVRYTMVLPPMTEDSEEPLMPYEVRSRLVWETLVDHFITSRDSATKVMWESENLKMKKIMTADIETTDDELILTVDRTTFSRQPQYGLENFESETE